MRIGIVGCGLIGRKRALAAAGHRIAIVADRVAEQAQALAAEAGGAQATTAWRDVIAADVDAVVVATPHNLLAEVTLAAVEAGKHVLVEKPAARTPAELEPVIAAAARRSVQVKVGFNHRFHPALLKAHGIAASGALGPLMFLRGRYGHGGRPGYEKEWRCDKEISGGGELIDQGSHLIDLARWFLGDLVLAYSALPTYFWKVSVEDNCFLALRAAGGQQAWLHASWTERKNLFCLEIYGRDGKLQVDGLGGSYGTERLAFYRMLPELGPPETEIWEFPSPDESWRAEFAEFALAITENRRPEGNLNDALAVLKIAEQAYGAGRP